MQPVGIQLLGELRDCAPELLNDAQGLERLVSAGVARCGFHQVQVTSKKFEPVGVTVIAIISESHVCIHTFPETKHASVDIFHCSGDAGPLHVLLNFLKESLGAESMQCLEINRGRKLEVNGLGRTDKTAAQAC